MEDLRLLATEQEFIVLEGSNGEKYRLALDESLRQALRADKGPKVETNNVSPREIQEFVRSGHSIDEIVAKTGASASYVEKFAAPVLDELQHIVNSALSVRLTFLGDRYGETNHIEFGLMIRERLDKAGATDVFWSAKRIETGGWQVTCAFDTATGPSVAKWSFDLRRLSLSPDNEVALNLAANSEGDSLVPKVKPAFAQNFGQQPVKPAVPADNAAATPMATPPSSSESLVSKNLTSSLGETQEFAEVIPFGRGRNTTAQVPVIAAGTSAEVNEGADADPIEDDEDLLSGLRRRRDARETNTGFTPILSVVRSGDDVDPVTAEDFDETTVWIDQTDEVFDEDQSQDDIETATEQTVSAPAPKKGRASMPSWDEIVFGTRPENKDD